MPGSRSSGGKRRRSALTSRFLRGAEHEQREALIAARSQQLRVFGHGEATAWSLTHGRNVEAQAAIATVRQRVEVMAAGDAHLLELVAAEVTRRTETFRVRGRAVPWSVRHPELLAWESVSDDLATGRLA